VPVLTDQSQNRNRRPRVLLGLSGSVATINVYELLALLTSFADVKIVTTAAGLHFFDPSCIGAIAVFTDQMEYASWKGLGDPVLHIQLRKWADVFLIAPLSANTLAKISNGLCDNLLTSIARAWDMCQPFIVAPAMNTLMWTHPITTKHLQCLCDLRICIIDPISKKLACGDIGQGAMANVKTIADTVRLRLDAGYERSLSVVGVDVGF
jgi:phosphopantothenoylcysteine decarboxylase